MKSKILILLFVFLVTSCSIFEKREKLDPESEQFLSETRYIITHEEKKEFLSLPPEKRKDYIEEFWNRRPAGFKEEYYKRIEEANKMFRGGRPGWLQDRGMVYIIYGPPTQMEKYPMGSASYPYAHEIWYYEYVQIVFVDPYNSGDYRLTAESLFSLDYIREIPTAMILDTRPSKEKKDQLKFETEIEKLDEGVLLRILIPYERISLKEIDGRLETELEANIAVSGAQSLTKSEISKISYSKEEIEKLNERYYKIEIPLKLKSGKYTAKITILNRFSKEKASGKIKFSV